MRKVNPTATILVLQTPTYARLDRDTLTDTILALSTAFVS